MPHADFVHLRVHSAYSLSEGAIKTKDLVGLCRKHAMPAMAVTDTDNLFGALEFALAAADAGVQPITGTLLGIVEDDRERPNGQRPAIDRIGLLVQSETGYRNLMGLVSDSYLTTEPGDSPHLSWERLSGRTDGLIALTGGPAGPVGRALAEDRPDVAEQVLLRLRDLFPGRLYVEVMRHGEPIEDRIEPALIDLADRFDLPLVATNDVFFTDAGMFEAHDALLCIAGGTYVSDPNRRRVTPEHRFKSAAEMRTLFADLPEAVDNTLVVARRCACMPEKR